MSAKGNRSLHRGLASPLLQNRNQMSCWHLVVAKQSVSSGSEGLLPQVTINSPASDSWRPLLDLRTFFFFNPKGKQEGRLRPNGSNPPWHWQDGCGQPEWKVGFPGAAKIPWIWTRWDLAPAYLMNHGRWTTQGNPFWGQVMFLLKLEIFPLCSLSLCCSSILKNSLRVGVTEWKVVSKVFWILVLFCLSLLTKCGQELVVE